MIRHSDCLLILAAIVVVTNCLHDLFIAHVNLDLVDFDTTAVTKNTESAKRPPYVPATVPAGISPTQSRDVMSGSSHSNSRSNLSSAGNSNNNLSAGGGSASKKLPTATAAAPAGDDFFKTFGV
jgi:hypothetical protein